MQKSFVIGAIALLLVLVVIIGVRMSMQTQPEEIACTADAMMCPDGSSVGRVGPNCEFAACPSVPEEKEDPIVNLFSPKADTMIASPIGITGKARGSWFYEGSFKVYLLDAQDQIIGETQAVAQSDWMTDDFVPFAATLSYMFPSNTAVGSGSLMLVRDNPSGGTTEDDIRKIPVRFPEAP